MKKTMKIPLLKHYTYLITDTLNRMYYIGVRSCKHEIINDGNYMGSSTTLKEAIDCFGLTNFTKTILAEWATRELAAEHEIQLHADQNVAINDQFYNKANATATGFTTLGNEEAVQKMLATRLKTNVWKESMDKNNKNPKNIASRSEGIRKKIKDDPTYVARRVASRLETIKTTAWQETTGMQLRENMRKTFNDPEWKETTGTEKSKKISELKRLRDVQNTKECIHCNKLIDPANYKRWHGNKCKFKEGV